MQILYQKPHRGTAMRTHQKEKLKLEEKQKPTFQLLLRPKVESDEGENVSAINAEDQEEADDEGNASNSSSIYTVKERKRKKTFNEHYKAPKYFYSVHQFSYTISDESASKETLKWLNSVLHKTK